MIILFSVLIGGILLGILLREKKLRHIHKFITIIIWTLLFCLGVEVGSNPDVVSNLGTLGVQALMVAIFASVGSVFFAWLLWKFIQKNIGEEKNER